MKTLFSFKCQSEELNIDNVLSFKLGAFDIEISPPDPKSYLIDLTILSSGEFHEIPLEIEEALIFIENFIKYTHCDFKISRGRGEMTLVPENDVEKAKVGDGLHSFRMWVQEQPRGVFMKKEVVQNMGKFYPARRLMSQFNVAEDSKSEINKYLSFFKIIEDSFYSGRGKLKTVLKSQNKLTEILKNIVITKKDPASSGEEKKYKLSDIPKTIDEMASLRDECAHLRSKNNFGFSETDLKALAKLSQYVELTKYVAMTIIDDLMTKLNST